MHLPNGSQIFVQKELDNAATNLEVTDIANHATDVEITFKENVNEKLHAGDYLIITECDWGRLVNRVVRIKSVPANQDNKKITVNGIDTSDVNAHPEGAIAGKVTRVKSWIEIPCVQDLTQDGGEQQYYTYQCLSDDQEKQIPTYKSAVSLTYTFAHEYDNAIYPILRKYDESGDVVALRMYIPKAKEMRCWSGVLAFNEIPQTAVNEMETVSLSVSLKGRFTFLPSTQ
ncbi:major tail protein [Hafnia phage Pocis76]|uniref:Major tail protein n=1 Tax=Hafnia phage Pocis76 TaxID=2831174 RepID=A0A8E7FN37_9CAUD|nr:major tail protein [Hafnia phage Pocis76]